MEPAAFRSGCALSSVLDLVGDKWSLLILRGLFIGFTRYKDFLAAPEGVATNILSDRLKRLETQGLIVKRVGQDSSGAVYCLTRAGADLLPSLQALAAWGHTHLPERWEPPDWFMDAKPQDYYPDSSAGGRQEDIP